jgi:TP901 family phage tail tape measure protein
MSKVGGLEFDASINLQGLYSDANKLEARIKKIENKTAASGRTAGKGFAGGLSKFINPATIGVTAISGALMKLGKDAYEFSKNFESSMLEVQTISTAVQDDFEGISEKVLGISLLPIKDDAIELNKALYQIVSAGFDGAAGLKVLEAAAKAATGGATETKIAADGLTTVMNAWGASVEDVDLVSDKMFTTVRLGKTTMGELSASIAQVAPLASSMGVSMDEVFAATASLTKQGVPTAQAMTQIRGALIGLNDNLGDGWSKTMTFQDGLQAMMDKAGGSQTELKTLMGRIEGVNGVLGMTGDKAKGAASDLDAMSKSAGAASAAFNVMGEDADIKWNQVGNKWKAMISDTGGTLVEASSALADFLNAALTSVDSLGDEFDEVGESVDGFSERMKVLRNEGAGLFGSVINAMTMSNEDVQGVVDSEKAEIQATKDEIAALREEYKRMEDEGASDEQLAAFKSNLQNRYKAILEATEKEAEAQKKRVGKSKLLGIATLGLTAGAVTAQKAGLKDKQDEVDNYKQLFDAVEGLGIKAEKEVKKTVDGTSKEIEAETKGLIQRLEEELKKLKDNSGKFTSIVGEAANEQAINNITSQIELARQKVQDELSFLSGTVGTADTKEVKGVKGPTPDESLATVKNLTKEEIKRLKAVKERILLEAKNAEGQEESAEKRTENLDELAGVLGDSSEIFGAMAYTAGQFDEGLGEALGKMSDIASQGANIVTSMAKQDWVGAVAGGIGLIGSLMSMNEENAEAQNKIAEEYNNILAERIDLLVQSGMITPLEGSTQNLEKLKADTEAALKVVEDYSAHINNWNNEYTKIDFGSMMGVVYGEDWNNDNLIEAGKDIDSFIAKYMEMEGLTGMFGTGDVSIADQNVLQQQINDYIAAAAAVNDAVGEMYSLILGFSSDELTSSIVDGIMNGFELAENGLGDFADSFNKLLRDAALQALTSTFENKYLNALMEKFNAAMEGDGKIDEDEMYALQDDYADAVRDMQEKADAWAHIIGTAEETTAAQEGLSGSIQGISEQTAGAMEGKLNAIQFTMIDMGDNIAQQLIVLNNIERNTSYNFHLEEMSDDIITLRKSQAQSLEVLKEINEKPSNGVNMI